MTNNVLKSGQVNTNEIIDQRLHYIHRNPVEAGFVSSLKIIFTAAQGLSRRTGITKNNFD